MSLSAAAAAMGIPEAIVQRSAEARAAETGAGVDDILAAWAGGEAVAAAAPAAEVAPAQEASAVETAPALAPEPQPAAPIIAAAPAEPVAATRAPMPTEVTAAEASRLPEVITVPTAGIRERTNFVIPKWLTAVILIVPLFALFALGGSATGECGEATELQTDVVTGEIVNCDGSEFTGQQIGGGEPDFIAMGGDLYSTNCASCHGANGEGVGTFPSMAGVVTTFGACEDHKLWVSLGSSGWPDATYGDTNKPVGVGMPPFGGSLSEEQLASVVAFERVRFAGADQEAALADCGLAESDGEGAVEGEAATEGGDAEASAAHTG